MKKNKTRLIVITALFTAITALCTAFISFHVLPNSGYIHFGDAIIMIAASILPLPFAVFTGAVGGAIGDLLTGAPQWAPFTFVIKALVALCFSSKGQKMLTARNAIGFIPMTAITIGGYYLAEALIYGNWVAPYVSIPGNAFQSIGSAIIFCIFSVALDRFKFKNSVNSLLNK